MKLRLKLGSILPMILLGALVACHDSPTSTKSSGTAMVAGQVQTTPGRVAPLGVTVHISIRDTNIATDAASDGSFLLVGVPSGDQTVDFRSSQGSGSVALDGVVDGEDISMSVTLDGSTAVLDSLTRSSGKSDEEESFEIHPDNWNLEWASSSGLVTAFIRGQGYENVDLATIRLLGDDPAAEPLAPVRATREGEHDKAEFSKPDALALLLDPQPGSTHEVRLDFSDLDGTTHELTDTVTIVGSEDGGGTDEGELRVQIQPDHWNTNWPGSSGTVAAFIRGNGHEDVDLGSIELVGTDPAAAPLAPLEARLDGDHVLARFAQADAYATLATPTPGSTHEIHIHFVMGGAETDLVDTITVVGPSP